MQIDIGGVSAPVILAMVDIYLLDVAVGGDVVQDPAQVIFIINKNLYCTKPTVILNFSTPSLFKVWPTVVSLKHPNICWACSVVAGKIN